MEISDYIWKLKYKDETDDTIHDTFNRVASHLAGMSKNYSVYYNAMLDRLFVPGGRILANAGTGKRNTLCNCFVMPQIEDSVGGIFEAVQKAALTLQVGGGVGMDFSTLRPRGALAATVGGVASGPVSFMKVWNTMCGTIMAGGNRRGAMMAVLRVDHPDIMEFITSKRNKDNGLTNFNISVAVTDDFMESLKDDCGYSTWFGGEEYSWLQASDVWNEIMKCAYESAEPGVIFIDRVNKLNPLKDKETIYATNPCGEQPLPPNGACVLGSVNLARCVTDEYKFEWDRFRHGVAVGVNLLNDVIDNSYFPLEEQYDEALNKRRIGLGVMGLGSALAMMRIKYGSEESLNFCSELFSIMANQARETSEGRNSHLLSIAPTGTTAIFTNNVSSGIEPIFAKEYTRSVLMLDGTKKDIKVKDYAEIWLNARGESVKEEDLAHNISPKEHVEMVATAQGFIDGAVSKTINCPQDLSFDAFKGIYHYAYARGCKGCTTYRPNDVTGAVLSVGNKSAKGTLTTRPDTCTGKTYKIKTPDSDHAIYVTINDAHGSPFEIFINTKDVTHYQWVTALTRMISAVFRRQEDNSFVYEELKAIFDPKGGYWRNGMHYPSILADIGSIIENHIKGGDVKNVVNTGKQCPKCGTFTLIMSEGCERCQSCDYSRC